MFKGALALRRLFVSACSTGQREFVDELHKTTRGIQSVVAPCVDVYFHHASIIWATLYVSLLEKDDGPMQHVNIAGKLQTLVSLFPLAEKDPDIPMKFMFASYQSGRDQGNTPRPEAWDIQFIEP